MYIKTVRLRSIRSAAVMLALVLAAAAVLVWAIGSAGTGMKDLEMKTEKDRQQFLSSMGWEVDPKYESCRQVTIPQKFTAVYKNYNDLQKRQGFDLSDYKGKNVSIYTYTARNYKGYSGKDCIKANLIVCEGKLIGGDVCSIELDGFMQGLKK